MLPHVLFFYRAFSAYEENVAVDTEQEHRERALLTEYKEKLKINDETLPDPVDLKSGWIGEESGMSFWPKLYFSDISRFYSETLAKKNLLTRLECDYKEGKAYRYFTNQFVGETYINNVTKDSRYCLFRTRCLPSQRVSSKLYTVWAIVKKDSINCPGGNIESAYCTCVAGLLGNCNHVAGMLFRIESAVLTGVAHPTCTSIPSKWIIPKGKKTIEPGRLSSFVFTLETYQSKSILPTSDERHEVSKKKLDFQVMSNTQKSKLEDIDNARITVYNIVKESVPKCCFVEFVEAQRHSVNIQTNSDVDSLLEMAETFLTNIDGENMDENVDRFCEFVKLSQEKIIKLEEATVDQADNEMWKKHRIGRLTASKFKRIFTRSNTLQQKPSENCDNLLAEIMGYNNFQPTWEMKHGIASEIHAKAKYKSVIRTKHKNCVFRNPGMTVMLEQQFISVSPDMVITCDCHGKGLVEIKCPATLIGKVPSDTNYKHLEVVDGELCLKKSSEYYFQVQGQMAVIGVNYCDFFVFSFAGFALVRVEFDCFFWNILVESFVWFWKQYVGPEILTKQLKRKMISEKVIMIHKCDVIDFSILDDNDTNNRLSEDIVSQDSLDITFI